MTQQDASQIIQKMKSMIKSENYLEEDEGSLNDVDEEKREIKRINRAESLYTVVDIDGDIAGVLILKRGNLKINHHIVGVRVWITEISR